MGQRQTTRLHSATILCQLRSDLVSFDLINSQRRIARELTGLSDDDQEHSGAPSILHAVEIAGTLKAHVTVMHTGGHLSELVSADPPNYGRVKPQLQIQARALL